MDLYPGEFPPEARDRIEREKILAYRELLPRSVYDFKEQNLAIPCIMRIFLAFAKEACALRKERGRTIERIESESKEFLRRLTIKVVFDKFAGLDRHWISNWNGSIDSDVDRRFRESVEWKEYEELLLATTNAEPSSTQEALIDRTIASWKRRMETSAMPGGSPLANTPALDARKSRSLLGIEPSDFEFIKRAVWVKFFDEASLPRAVELEWEPVLSSQKIPDSDVQLGLTFALTKAYAKAIERPSAELADLLVTKAVSRISQAYFREAIWRECLDFAYQLGQWDAFASWVGRVTPPLIADGAPDRERLETAAKQGRDFFEKRIGMYSQEWLSAIDGAIELRCVVSAAHNVNSSDEIELQALAAEVLAKNQESEAPGTVSRTQNPKKPTQLTEREAKIWAVIQRKVKGLRYCRELGKAGIAPLRKGVWKDCPRNYESAYRQGHPWRHRIQVEKSKTQHKAKLAGLTKLASE